MNIAIVGSGISGLSAAWLLSERHDVTLFEQAERVGGHSNTVIVDGMDGPIGVDTGFIVYNEATYPNLVALFDHIGVETQTSDMSFGVSLDGGRLEYAGTDLLGLFAQRRNLVSPRYWSMLRDLLRFYREAPRDLEALPDIGLGAYLERGGYGAAFREDHLVPMAAAIWSAPSEEMLSYPARSFIRFFDNHGLLKITDRPVWRTVVGGSRAYVAKLTQGFADRIRLNAGIRAVRRVENGVDLTTLDGKVLRFNQVVIATHADQALKMLADADRGETQVLGAFRYSRNLAVLHDDPAFMPKLKRAWSSWNYLADRRGGGAEALSITYWMNRLQQIDDMRPLFVTLNPAHAPRAGSILHSEIYEHPIFDAEASRAQARLWSLQGRGGVWYCGAHFGAGFHEDGLQAGLAVAEVLGGVRRPWRVENESGRIAIDPGTAPFVGADV